MLDDLGEEVTGVVTPVSICMALTVALVRILNPTGESPTGGVYLASAYYTEQVSREGGWGWGGQQTCCAPERGPGCQ